MESKFVNKKQAKGNENIEYGEISVLHSTNQSEITLMPFFIKHSDPTKERDLRIKLERKRFVSGLPVEVCEINMNEKAILRLRDKLNELLALKKIPDNGNFLLVKLGDGQQVDLSGLDTTDVAKALVSVLENPTIFQPRYRKRLDNAIDTWMCFRRKLSQGCVITEKLSHIIQEQPLSSVAATIGMMISTVRFMASIAE